MRWPPAITCAGSRARRAPSCTGASDPSRDQSYFLFATTRDQLDFLRFPLGDLTKTETRAIAERLGLAVADKPDSQDICFVPEGSYASLVAKLRPGALTPGDIVDLAGTVLGRHEGIINFTVGQRRGLALGGHADRLFVIRIEPEAARVVVGPREALADQPGASGRDELARPLGRNRRGSVGAGQAALGPAAGAGTAQRRPGPTALSSSWKRRHPPASHPARPA